MEISLSLLNRGLSQLNKQKLCRLCEAKNVSVSLAGLFVYRTRSGCCGDKVSSGVEKYKTIIGFERDQSLQLNRDCLAILTSIRDISPQKVILRWVFQMNTEYVSIVEVFEKQRSING